GGTQIVNIAAIADDGNNGLDPTPEDNSDDDVNTATVMPDLVIPAVDRSGTTTDFQVLTVQGDVAVQLENTGNLDANDSFQVTIFEDSDTNGIFSAGTDNILGQEVYTDPLTVGQSVWFSIPISGAILFRDNLLYAFVDSGEVIAESDETNNYSNTGQVCEFIPPVGSFNPVVKFHALEGLKVISTPMVVNLTDDNGDGQIDEHDIPDLVFATMPTDQWSGGPIKAISGDDGHELFTAGEPDLIATLNELGVADIDGDNLPEIVAAHSDGYHLIAFEHTGEFKWLSTYDELPGRYDSGGAISIANLDGAGPPEIVVGASVYSADGTLLGDGRDLGGTWGFNSFSAISSVADVDLDGIPEIIAGPSVYRFVGGALTLLWRRSGVFDGFTGIANFDDDPFAEILIVGWGQVYMLNHDGSNAEVWSPQTNGRVFRPGGGAGGAPTIADYDGDGELEIGIAGASRYVVFERDGSVRWTSVTSDYSSNTTGSTPFDFEGDGSVEVVYRDEQFLRIYRGTDGFILFEMPMRSGTATELPVVADVDNDGNAEIAVCSDYLFGGSPSVDTGIYVFEDANDTWVNTRTIWNQHSYHITNINDDATVPLKEENNWERFNNYRQNMPIAGSVFASPDLTASFIRFAEDAGNVTITVRIGNGGANIVGTGVPVSFYDGDPTSGGTLLGTTQTAQNLNPGDFEDVTFTWLAPPLGTYNIYVAADDDGTGAGTGNECDETNNLHWQPCFVGVDLVIAKDDGQTTVLPGENVTYTLSVSNVGILPATGVVISDTLPSQGITFVSASDGGSESGGIVTWPTFDLAAGASVTRTVTIQVEDPLPAGVDTIINTVTVTDDGIHGVDLTPDDNEASDITSIILIIDSDGDGVPDDLDNCPNVANPGQEDADNDGFGDVCETCPNDPDKTEAGICGCGVTDTDSDGDGIADCNDECPNDPNKTEPGDCGCGVVDTDSDGDGTPDCNDNCPTDPNKTEPGICDCGVADDDSDGDGTADCIDECPDDPDKTEAGICGCGNPDTDSDGDGTPDCNDNCPTDPNKTEAGICGCGVADTDSDGDGTADCIDNCPDDPDKIDPGVCDCGTPDTDSDGDGTPDCIDNCPADPDKTEPGICGCGVADTDSDGDGTPD
ncbi:MAG: DUF11 domain-containing protein, partial [Gammaproteobacteria bacterium]|nr:DUF11 domain-containing protein [Gammaproteobacteria bacterium]